MQRNKALQAELLTSIDNLQDKLKARGKKIYKKELDILRIVIQKSLKISPQEHSVFFVKNNIVKCMLKIIRKIDNEIAAIEKEMHGLEFYPGKMERLKDINFKQAIKNELINMRDKVIRARHEMSDQHVFQMMTKLYK